MQSRHDNTPVRPTRQRTARRLAGVLAAVTAGALSLAACSSSGGASDTAGNTSGDPVVIGIIGDDTGTVIQNPSGGILAQIAAAAVNDRGGIKGRPLKVVTCDAKSDPQAASVCARKLLQDDKVVALVGDYTTSQGAAIYPALQQAGTVSMFEYPSIAADQQNPLSYPVIPGTAGTIGLVKAVPSDATTVAVVHFPSTAGTAASKAFLGRLPSGTTGVDSAVQLSTVDYQPTCLDLKSKNVQAVAVFVNDSPTQQMITACKQIGFSPTWLLPSITQSTATLTTIGGLGVKAVVAAGYGGSAYQQMLDEVDKYKDAVGDTPTNVVGDVTVNAWLAVTLAAKVFNAIPTIDGANIAKYLDAQSSFETGMTPPVDFTKPGPISTMPRIVNTSVAISSIEDGRLVTDDNAFASFAG